MAELEPLNSFTPTETAHISPFDTRLCDAVLLLRVAVSHGVSGRRWLDRMMLKEMTIWNGKLLSILNTKIILDDNIAEQSLLRPGVKFGGDICEGEGSMLPTATLQAAR